MRVPDVLQIALKDETLTLVLIPHAESVRAQTSHVPVWDAGNVETGTVVVIPLAFVYLLRTFVRASRAQRVAVEVQYPQQKKNFLFERPYGPAQLRNEAQRSEYKSKGQPSTNSIT